MNFTNAAFIVQEGFKLPEDGLYSGFDEASKTYDRSSWNYEAKGASERQYAAWQTSLSTPRSNIRAASISC